MSDKAYSVRIAIIDSGFDDVCNYNGLSVVSNEDNNYLNCTAFAKKFAIVDAL